jgi:hypothetical protein
MVAPQSSQRIATMCACATCWPMWLLQALLSCMDLESDRLVQLSAAPRSTGSSKPAAPQSSAGAAAAASRPGNPLLSRMQGLLTAALQGSGAGGGDSPPAAATGTVAAGSSQVDVPEALSLDSFWAEMRRLAWCPALSAPPEAGMPWPPDGQRQQPGGGAGIKLVPPRTARPLADAWMCSATMAVVAGDCRCVQLAGAPVAWSRPRAAAGPAIAFWCFPPV